MTLLNEFTQFKNKVTETAKSAMQKSNEIFEVTKINMSIGDAQVEIDKILKDIGQILYDSYQNGESVSDEVADKCVQVDEVVEKIKEMKVRLMELKNVIICSNCENENQPDDLFCSKCGEKIGTEKSAEEENVEEESMEQESVTEESVEE